MSGYTHCQCRDCFEITVSDDQTKPDFCDDCTKAGCPDYQGVEGMSQECQRPDAYGDEGDQDVRDSTVPSVSEDEAETS